MLLSDYLLSVFLGQNSVRVKEENFFIAIQFNAEVYVRRIPDNIERLENCSEGKTTYTSKIEKEI